MPATLLPLLSAAELVESSIPKHVSFLGGVYVVADSADQALQVLQQTAARLDTYIDVSAFPSGEDIIRVIDAGASTVIVTKAQLDGLASASLDQDRVALLITGVTKEEIVDAVGDKSIGLFASNVADVDLMEAWLNEYGKDHPPVYVSFKSPSEEHAIKVSKLGGIPVVPADQLSAGGPVSAAKVLLAGAQSDRPDGLFTTIVTDERGTALGLVYSSEKSLEESLRTGRGVYQSRKRGLWYKGDSSGDVQELLHVAFDCDQDCLLFVVRQKGKGK